MMVFSIEFMSSYFLQRALQVIKATYSEYIKTQYNQSRNVSDVEFFLKIKYNNMYFALY